MECINKIWQDNISDLAADYTYFSRPRGRDVREKIGIQYKYDLSNSVITLAERNMNYGFMFAEAAWILSGRNDLDYITKYMKSYSNYSDDGLTLNGAYGPKIVDQLSWCKEQIVKDKDTRQSFLNIWRERPAKSKDIPCTTSIQFLVRDNVLHLVVNMRSQDVLLGFCYDVFVFSMIARAMQLMLLETKSKDVDLGICTVNVGSFHLYDSDYDTYYKMKGAVNGYVPVAYQQLYLTSGKFDALEIAANIPYIYPPSTFKQLIEMLNDLAEKYKKK